jgi:hypothetical protein
MKRPDAESSIICTTTVVAVIIEILLEFGAHPSVFTLPVLSFATGILGVNGLLSRRRYMRLKRAIKATSKKGAFK